MPSDTNHPLGHPISFCAECGASVRVEIPAGDNRLRYVCNACTVVHYENPKLVIGCVAVYGARILLCKRAIAPRLGYWTLPAGFMELGESQAAAAARETQEEACAEVRIDSLLATVNVIPAGQVHVFYRATLLVPEFAAGPESLEVALVEPSRIPWAELAFTSNRIALEQHLLQTRRGSPFVWTGNAI